MLFKICPKCSYERKETDSAPDYECPSCGVIYEKYIARQAELAKNSLETQQKEMPKIEKVKVVETDSDEGKVKIVSSRLPLIFGLVAAIAVLSAVAGGYFYYQEQKKEERRAEVEAYAKKLKDMHERWGDVSKLAGRTARIALSGPVGNLQQIQRQTKELPIPPACLADAKKSLEVGMSREIDMFLMFMGNSSSSSNSGYYEVMIESARQFSLYQKVADKPTTVCEGYIENGT